MRKLTRRTSAVAVGIVAATGVGVAFAAWTSSGAGTGSAASKTSANSVIAGVTPIAANDLYPGAVTSAFVTVTNPNDYPVEVTQINAGGSRAAGLCAAGSVRTDQAGTGASALTRSDVASTVIAAGGTGTYQLVLRMSNTATDDCKSKSFTIGDQTTPANDLGASLRSAASTAGNNF